MLELNKITKTYNIDDTSQKALNNVSLKFRKKEFVCVLGPSGSGKTTLLNIIGGLDNYLDGNLIINGKSTKKFKEKDFDFYRNALIGFVFQNYNLINHVSVYKNVEMALLLNSTRKNKRKKLVLDALKKVGLENHINKKPNELSGGQMQRVAIARALVNNPDIILADEPTGALDSKTSIKIMELIKEISLDKLVIMVTHNDVLAKKYASRIIKLEDGKVINDTNPFNEVKENNIDIYKIKKTNMSFLSAIYLSLNNVKTKLKRTILTCFASSIGIIGIALILSVSNGFNKEIDEYQKGTMSSFPIGITSEVRMTSDNNLNAKDHEIKKDVLYKYDDNENNGVHVNKITEDYINYVKNINKDLLSGISYNRIINFNLMSTNGISYKMINQGSIIFSNLPDNEKKKDYLNENYDLLIGTYPKEDTDVVLIVDDFNKVDEALLNALFLGGTKEVPFDRIVGKEFKVISNDDYYLESNKSIFIKRAPLKEIYNKSDITLKIVGIVKKKTDDESVFKGEENGGKAVIGYQNALIERIINQNKESKIVKAQENAGGVVFMGNISFEEAGITKEQVLVMLGKKDLPVGLNIYSNGFNNKDRVIKYLDNYNKDKYIEDKIMYTDYAKEISNLTHNIMNAITIVLIAFSSISLIVSAVMIGIITYISVLERTKEIGILRSLGARKKDISRVFNAETLLIGLASGIIGVCITSVLLFPINTILYNLTDIKNLGILSYKHAIILVLISVILTLIGGLIPAKVASKKNPVEVLRSE